MNAMVQTKRGESFDPGHVVGLQVDHGSTPENPRTRIHLWGGGWRSYRASTGEIQELIDEYETRRHPPMSAKEAMGLYALLGGASLIILAFAYWLNR